MKHIRLITVVLAVLLLSVVLAQPTQAQEICAGHVIRESKPVKLLSPEAYEEKVRLYTDQIVVIEEADDLFVKINDVWFEREDVEFFGASQLCSHPSYEPENNTKFQFCFYDVDSASVILLNPQVRGLELELDGSIALPADGWLEGQPLEVPEQNAWATCWTYTFENNRYLVVSVPTPDHYMENLAYAPWLGYGSNSSVIGR